MRGDRGDRRQGDGPIVSFRLLYDRLSETYFVHGSDSSKLIRRLINKISLCAVPRLKNGAAFAPAKFISLGFAKNFRLGVHKTCFR